MAYRVVIFDFEGTIVHGDNVYDDARALIIQLKKVGILLGIASNTSTQSIQERLEKNKMLEYFDAIVGIDQVNFEGKPSPHLFIRAAEDLDCSPGECLVIEDSESGVEGACAAGMNVVLVRGAKYNQALYSCVSLDDAELHRILFDTI